MSSNINTTSINADYPVAGQDNDSQGFRDNFGTIKDNFVAAKSEIETLQNNTAKKNENNNFLGNNIQQANFIANTEELFEGGTVGASQNISFNNGHIQTFTVNADITLTLADWPVSGKFGKITAFLLSDGQDRTITWAVEGGGSIVKNTGWPTEDNTTVISSSANQIVIDFYTFDNGSKVFAEYKGLFE